MSIIDTLPPLPEPDQAWDFAGHANVYPAWAVRERDRIVAEHVIRACAEVCRAEARHCADMAKGDNRPTYDDREQAALDCAGEILALLKDKPVQAKPESSQSEIGE